MKLRIKGDSIRLRLSQAEVADVASGKAVSVDTRFPDGQSLTYRFSPHADPAPKAGLADSVLSVCVPHEQARSWASGDDISLHAQVKLPEGGELSLLIEKDFQCLVPRDGEEQAGLYPHPESPDDGA